MENQTSKPIRGLLASIYHHPRGNFSNHGISSRVNDVTIVGPDIDRVGGNIFEPTDKAPAVVLVRRTLHRSSFDPSTESYEYVHAEPLDAREAGGSLAMGGTYITTSDSRFYEATGTSYPIPLHDHRITLTCDLPRHTTKAHSEADDEEDNNEDYPDLETRLERAFHQADNKIDGGNEDYREYD